MTISDPQKTILTLLAHQAMTRGVIAIHFADSMVARRDSAAWRRYANEHLGVEFFRLTKPGGVIG